MAGVRDMGSPSMKGFTLMEVIIACAIIAILSAIAVPSYRQHVVKTHRVQAQTCIASQASVLERHYTRVLDYQGAPQAQCAAELTAYQLRVHVAASGYTVTAEPLTEQADHACGTLSMDHTGLRLPVDRACW